ncbi:MAG: hypothetical protein HY910_05350 [Desulfarculus sp.]|nr:hypothetical protein [Desulfarculus sp.]
MWRRIANDLNPPRPGQPRQPGAAPAGGPGGVAAPQAAGLKVSRYTFCQHGQCPKSAALAANLRREAARQGLALELAPALTLCQGACQDGPFLGLPQLDLFYAGVTPSEAGALLAETSLAGRLVFRRLYLDPTVVTDSRVIFERHQGTLVAMEAGYCLVGLVTYLFEFNAAESCGKCYPCRLGVHLIHRLLRGILAGQGGEAGLERLVQATRALAQAGYCQFGERITEPLRLALGMARPVFQRHLDQGGCAAGERHLWPASPGESAQ